jgi:tetratricopeptide (TPR) repeat protein
MTTTSTVDALPPEAVAARLAMIAKVAGQDLARAMALAAHAKADGLRSPLIHHLLGLELKDAGDFEGAIAELGLGLELAPQDAGLVTTVGLCLLELNRRHEAARILETAMKLDPMSADALFGYGWAADRLGSLDAAQSAYGRAVAINPNHADALAGLSGLAVRRREWDTARELAERARRLDSRQTDALMNLARADIGEGHFEGARAQLEAIIALPFLKPLARANCRILIGDALDGLGRYPEAFAAYAEGKTELGDLHAGEFRDTGRPTPPEVFAAMLAEFEQAPAKSWRSPPAPLARGPERGHAFLLGFPRSGTTLLEQVIATHPDMVALGERPVMIDAESEFLTRAGGITRLAAVLPDVLAPFRDSYWRRVRGFGIDPAGKVFVDKHPLSTMRIPLMYKMFPKAKFIFAVRDPRDVVLSCFRRSFHMNINMYEFNSLSGAARMYDAVMTAGAVYMSRLPIEVCQVRHEDLVADFESSARVMCDFLRVDWTPKLNDFAQTKRSIATPSGQQIAKGLNADGVGHWRHYAASLEPVMPILAPWIEKFGYAPD